MDENNPGCEGIFIQDGIIKAIGSTDEIVQQAELENTLVVDLKGKGIFYPAFTIVIVHMMSTVCLHLVSTYSIARRLMIVLNKLKPGKNR